MSVVAAPAPNLLDLLARRERELRHQIKQLADNYFRYSVDLADADNFRDEITSAIDTKKMTCTLPISVQVEDRSRDVVITAGIDTSNHEKNPIVLFEHGLIEEYRKPVAKAEGPNGYTVKVGKHVVTATSYFSQKDKKAVEIFALIAEGILRGASIGFNPKSYRPNHDDIEGRGGLILDSVEMVEYSHAIIPDNQECVAAVEKTLSRGRIDGSPISAPVLKFLTAHRPPRQSVANGWTPPLAAQEVKTMADATMTTNELDAGAATVPDEPNLTTPEKPKETEPEGDDKAPPGSKYLAEAYDAISMLGEHLAERAVMQEHPKVAKYADSIMSLLSKACDEAGKYHSDIYPDLPALAPKKKSDDAAATTDDADKPADDGMGDDAGAGEGESDDLMLADDAEPDEAMQKAIRAKMVKRREAFRAIWAERVKAIKAASATNIKRMSKAAATIIRKAAEDINDVADDLDGDKDEKTWAKVHRSAHTRLKHHATQLHSIKADTSTADDDDNMKSLRLKCQELERRATKAEAAFAQAEQMNRQLTKQVKSLRQPGYAQV